MFNNLMYEQEQEGDFVEARTYFGSREIFEGSACPPSLEASGSRPFLYEPSSNRRLPGHLPSTHAQTQSSSEDFRTSTNDSGSAFHSHLGYLCSIVLVRLRIKYETTPASTPPVSSHKRLQGRPNSNDGASSFQLRKLKESRHHGAQSGESAVDAVPLSRSTSQLPRSYPKTTRRPRLASSVTSLKECERWRGDVLREISRKVSKIQDFGLTDYEVRDLNDEINKLLREKTHWENQILSLGGANYKRAVPSMGGDEGVGKRGGYKYFGRAKDLPGVKSCLPPTRGRRRGGGVRGMRGLRAWNRGITGMKTRTMDCCWRRRGVRRRWNGTSGSCPSCKGLGTIYADVTDKTKTWT